MLNIIQCIAFGFLVIEVRDIFNKDAFSFPTALRGINSLVIILFIWHRYTTEFQYLWPMSFLDTVIPFAIGISECFVVFCINSREISLRHFILGIMLVQGTGMVAYSYAGLKRNKPFTQDLYEDFYDDPRFVSCLINFLKKYDEDHEARMRMALGFSLAFFVIAVAFPNAFVDVVFSLVCIALLAYRAFFHSFDECVKRDKDLGPYFQ